MTPPTPLPTRAARIASAALLLAALAAAPAAAQQGEPPRPTNLRVLPQTISHDSLIATMRGFARALGVRCSYCHVEVERDGRVVRDMAADDKREKRVAREMLRMVADVNARLAMLPARSDPPVVVRCVTCHRGAALPRTLQDTLMIAYHGGGVDSLASTYATLRARHHGRASYDFGAMTLADVGARLADGGMPADAAAVYRLNLEQFPDDAATHAALGVALLATGDTAAALASLRRALELEPRDRRTRALVDSLDARAE